MRRLRVVEVEVGGWRWERLVLTACRQEPVSETILVSLIDSSHVDWSNGRSFSLSLLPSRYRHCSFLLAFRPSFDTAGLTLTTDVHVLVRLSSRDDHQWSDSCWSDNSGASLRDRRGRWRGRAGDDVCES